MPNPMHRNATALACGLVASASLLGCDGASARPEAMSAMADTHAVGAGQSGETSAAVQQELARLRRATAHFQDIARAQEAGYEVLVTHPVTGASCLSHEEMGGMGLHYLNPALMNDEVVVEQPEVVLYEEGPNGSLRLVAVEYLIPFAIRGTEAPAPVLFGQEFVQNHTFDVWALHVWVWKDNPSGMFADWNPQVSC
jgi:hypothetical protein